MGTRFSKTFFAGLLIVAAAGMWTLAVPARTEARACDGFYGRACGRGYFKNNYASGGKNVLNNGMPGIGNGEKQKFIDRVLGHLNSGDRQQVTAAQFIILTMIGNDGGVAKSVSQSQIDDWKLRIQAGNIMLRIDSVVFECNISNAYYQDIHDDVGSLVSDSSEGCGQINDMINFFNLDTGKLVYQIRVACANPLGKLDGLPKVPEQPTTPPPPSTPPPPPPVPPTRPYFQAGGADVVAGSSFLTDSQPCSAAPNIDVAGIVGWNRRGTPNYGGAGGQYAAFARGFVQDFVSRQAGLPPASSQLTFANKSYAVNGVDSLNASKGLYGGQFADGASQCVDYWKDRPAAAAPAPTGDVQLNDLNGVVNYNGDLRLDAATLRNGKQITLYVKGNVTIAGDITYAGGNTGAYTSRGQIPSLRLIVNGVIFIRNTVKELNGTYVAIPTAGETTKTNSFDAPLAGTISTCSRDGASYNPAKLLTTDKSYIGDCNPPLRVVGSMVAQQVWLLRTGGDVTDGPSEVFQYAPEVWLAPSNGNDASTSTDYQSIIGLPPTL